MSGGFVDCLLCAFILIHRRKPGPSLLWAFSTLPDFLEFFITIGIRLIKHLQHLQPLLQ